MKWSIAYLGILASVILGGILGLCSSVLALYVLDALGADFVCFAGGYIVIIGTALGAFIGGVLAVVHVRRHMRKLRDAKYPASVPENAGDFIKAIIQEMRYRKKVRADVQAELAAHFEDELCDCKTDEEKEKRAEQLITEFGDVKLLAVLLRRAKKRCRPLWRKVVARGFQTVGVLILCLIAYTAWFLTGKPLITIDYVAELNKIVCPTADESLNAAPSYQKAVEMTKDISEGGGIFYLLGSTYDEVNDVDKQLIKQWMSDNKEVLELIVAGAQKPFYWQKYDETKDTGVVSIDIPSLAGFRKLAFALRWRIWLSVEQGRYEDAFGDIKTCYLFGRHLKGDKTLIEQLVGMAIEGLAVGTLNDVLSDCKIDSAKLAAFQQDFEKTIAEEDFTVSLKAEKLLIYDEVQRCFTEDFIGGGHISLDGIRRLQVLGQMSVGDFDLLERFWDRSLHVLFTHPNKEQTREMTDRLYDFWETVFRKSPACLRAEGIDIEKETMEMVKGNVFLEIAPALSRLNKISHRSRIGTEATLTIIAVLRYKQDTGDYPDSLKELIAANYLKELPIDPYSDKPLVYKTTDDSFILYGVGLNFADDGGTVAEVNGKPVKWGTKEQGDWVLWPVIE